MTVTKRDGKQYVSCRIVDADTVRYGGNEFVRRRTCEMIDLKSGDQANYECEEHVYHCKICHAERGVYAYNEDGDVWGEMPKFCPECGAKVVAP